MLTRLLVAVNVIAYLWEQVAGSNGIEQRYGLVGAYVLQGQWYRVFTSGFLHADILHIAFNMMALWQVGSFIEVIYGTPRMALIYFIALVCGSLTVVQFAPDVLTIGASGAIFGLFGALAVAGLRLGKPGREILQQTTGIIVINLLITFFPGTNISWEAHLGGLLAGAFCGLVLFRVPRQRAVAYSAAPEAGGAVYAQRIDPRRDAGVMTIEHEPLGEPPRQPPPA